MTIEQVTNRQIKQFFDAYIKGKKNVHYFVIATGSFYDQIFKPANPKTEDYTGEQKFLEALEAVLIDNPYQISISVFERTAKSIRQNPLFEKVFVLHKEVPKPKQDIAGLGDVGLESLGGLAGIYDTKVNAKFLAGENKRLEEDNKELKADKKALTEKVANLTEKVSDLKEDIKTKTWELNTLKADHVRIVERLEDDHKRELSGIEDKNDKFEKIITVGGLVAAKIAKVDEESLRGLFGEDTFKAVETKPTESNKSTSTDDVEIEEVVEYTGKKAEAKQLADNINNALSEIIEKNNDENAYKILASFFNVFMYGNSSVENLTKLNDMVVSEYNNQQANKTAADNIIDKVEEYKQQ